MSWKLPLFRIYWDESDIEAVNSVIRRGSFWADGPEITEFERDIAGFVGREHGVAFSNGTAALHALMLAYDIGPGDEVIVPSFTFISTANAPLFTGARPVFAEVEGRYFGMDPNDVRKRITERTKAILPIHYGGHPFQVDELSEIARDSGVLLLEDAAEALGALHGERQVGSFGDAAMFSFCQNKVVSTGEGGAVVTDDEELVGRLRLIRSHGRGQRTSYFDSTVGPDYVTLGYNFRMPTVLAALGRSQLAKIESIIAMRRQAASRITRALKSLDGIRAPLEMEGCRHVYQLYTVLLDNSDARDGLKSHLEERGIMSKVYFDPVHLTELYRTKHGHASGDLPVTEDLGKRVLTLPLFPGMKDDEAKTLTDAIKEYMGG